MNLRWHTGLSQPAGASPEDPLGRSGTPQHWCPAQPWAPTPARAAKGCSSAPPGQHVTWSSRNDEVFPPETVIELVEQIRLDHEPKGTIAREWAGDLLPTRLDLPNLAIPSKVWRDRELERDTRSGRLPVDGSHPCVPSAKRLSRTVSANAGVPLVSGDQCIIDWSRAKAPGSQRRFQRTGAPRRRSSSCPVRATGPIVATVPLPLQPAL